MSRVDVDPKLIRWARERSGADMDALLGKFPKLRDWERRKSMPTMRQIEKYANATRTPLGYFFLSEPPEDTLPIPDFRTVSGASTRKPSPELLDTVEMMQRRQEWMREYLIEEGAAPLAFVGSASLKDDPNVIAGRIRAQLGFASEWAEKKSTWSDALRKLRLTIEEVGVLVAINGVVGNDTHRVLDPEEFRGFALCDEYAPLIFVNGADAKAAQMFTLVHELAHVWLGRGGVSNFESLLPVNHDVEAFCNRVAAEFLVPESVLRNYWREAQGSFDQLARRFKVSPLVAARRALDLKLIKRTKFFEFYNDYLKEEDRKKADAQRGNFYNNQVGRIGIRFARAVYRAAKEGRLLYRDAYQLTGLHGKTFDQYGRMLDLGFQP